MNRTFYCYDIQKRLDFLINNSGIPKAEICRRIGISRSGFYDARFPSLRVVVGVGAITKANMNWLIYGKGEPYE